MTEELNWQLCVLNETIELFAHELLICSKPFKLEGVLESGRTFTEEPTKNNVKSSNCFWSSQTLCFLHICLHYMEIKSKKSKIEFLLVSLNLCITQPQDHLLAFSFWNHINPHAISMHEIKPQKQVCHSYFTDLKKYFVTCFLWLIIIVVAYLYSCCPFFSC